MLKYNFKNKDESRYLTVTLNSGKKFNLNDFEGDLLQILPMGFNWYLSMAPEKAQQLVDLIRTTGHKEVVVTGSSKTGYAAILMAALAAPLAPDINFYVCAWAPVTYFYNGERFNPKMSTNLRKALDTGLLHDEIEAYGDLNKPLSKVGDNLKVMVVHSSHSKWMEDVRYARHIDRHEFVKSVYVPWERYKGHFYPNGKVITVHKIIAYFWIHKRKQFYQILDNAFEMENTPK